ncbi:hypothetical protein EHR01_12365 [Leptospira mtsangambouensis]|uniref:ATP-binding protein n=1 Tax=Leptospira mtsangambouensis TaxID=2484912 RepID=A0ABY2NZL3_9LEPT|nr:hypothetical protein [Leptospira mtsangambouensis]TGM74289.1 hypothetical protein EHR01_12365 [Leptospira mtsangambouensis]
MDNTNIFLNVVDSLSRYRRAEIIDESTSESLIESLYVDPLENDLILKSMMKKNTVLLIGRKGTGKSTIINRFQHEIRKTNDRISLYIDVNALFEQAKKTSFQTNLNSLGLSQRNLERLNLYIAFIEKVITEINAEIKKNIFNNPIINLFSTQGITKNKFDEELENLFKETIKPTFQNITDSQQIASKTKQSSKEDNLVTLDASLELKNPHLKTSIKAGESSEMLKSDEFTSILSRYFNIIKFMNDLKILLSKIPIKDVSICLDDVSEIDKDSLEIFIKFIVAPLNNLSDEYYKFKISLYPGRDYLPGIDRQKVKTFNLDYYELYSLNNSEKVEEQAIAYTERLLEKRFKYYFGEKFNIYSIFHIDKENTPKDLYKLLFQISANVPRILGKILEIALQKTNSLTTKINRKILQESARQHDKNDIEYILKKNESIEYKSYDESFEQFHLAKLLNLIIQKAIENKKHIGKSTSNIFKDFNANTAPSNYLYFPKQLEDIVKTLEFNFYISKFSEQKHRDGDDISVYVLNYGLCIDNNIIFDNGSNRKFRIERIFDFEKLIREWMNGSKKIICENCSAEFNIEEKGILQKYGCLTCKSKLIKIKSVISQIEHKKITESFKIPKNQFDILISLNSKSPQTATLLGSDLDRSYQSISQSTNKNSKLVKHKLIDRTTSKGKTHFRISNSGISFLKTGKI